MSQPFILIIGNGFDLNLGLKTGYKDFISSNEFTEIKNNQLCEHLIKKLQLQNWIDIEKELKLYSVTLGETLSNFEQEFSELCNALVAYLKRIEADPINTDTHAFLVFKKLLSSTTGLKVINFNYTNTVEKTYKDLKKTEISRDGLIKIHGSINENNIIFGVEDNANIHKEHIFIRKAYAQNYGKRSIEEELLSSQNITFFGLSLGESDHSHFKKLFMQCCLDEYRRRIFTFYYFGKEGYKNLMMQIESLTENRLGDFKSKVYFNLFDLSTMTIDEIK
jgi:hypothetical protein